MISMFLYIKQPSAMHNTTVVVQQAPQPQPQPPRVWSTGMCECCDDIGTCKYRQNVHAKVEYNTLLSR